MYVSDRNAPRGRMMGEKRCTIDTIEYALTPTAPSSATPATKALFPVRSIPSMGPPLPDSKKGATRFHVRHRMPIVKLTSLLTVLALFLFSLPASADDAPESHAQMRAAVQDYYAAELKTSFLFVGYGAI